MITNDYLTIFTRRFEVDYQLPKYEEALDDLIRSYAEKKGLTPESVRETLERDMDAIFTLGKGDKTFEEANQLMEKYKASQKGGIVIEPEKFDKLGAKDLVVLSDQIGFRRRSMDADFAISATLDELGYERKRGWFEKIINKWEKKKEEKSHLRIDVLDFFRLVKLTTEENMSEYIDRCQPYLLAIERAKEMGQQALVDQYLSGMFIAKYESILRAEGLGKCINEAQLVEFAKNSSKGLALDYIKNYVRPIPEEVIEAKKKADGLHIFDNYCVLHYDPEKKATKQTAKEKEEERRRKADPILFGMIEGSRRLYYIADWIDEYCDLTLEQFLKASGLTEKDIEIEKEIRVD